MKKFKHIFPPTYYELAVIRLKAELRKIINENSKKLGGDADGERTDV